MKGKEGKVIMKKLVCMLVLLAFVFSGFAFAGAPKPIGEKPIPVEKEVMPITPQPPKAAAEPLVINKYGTRGLGLGGNPMFGTVEKDEIALYPQTEYGFTWVLGYGVTWFNGQPTAAEIRAAAATVKSKYGNSYGDKTFAQLVREELGVTSLGYVTLGTALLIVPANAEIGTMWIINDNMRTRLGFGLPTIISFGINWDF